MLLHHLNETEQDLEDTCCTDSPLSTIAHGGNVVIATRGLASVSDSKECKALHADTVGQAGQGLDVNMCSRPRECKLWLPSETYTIATSMEKMLVPGDVHPQELSKVHCAYCWEGLPIQCLCPAAGIQLCSNCSAYK